MTDISALRSLDRARPVYLLEIILNGVAPPTLFFSDVNINVGGQDYQDYLILVDSLKEQLERATSVSLNSPLTLTFKNAAFRTYSHLIKIDATNPFLGGTCVIKEVYLDDNGIPSTVEVLFKGVLESLMKIGLLIFTCKVSSVEFASDLSY